MTSRNAEELRESDVLNSVRPMTSHRKHHRHHESVNQIVDDKSPQQLLSKYESRKDNKPNVEDGSYAHNHPIQSISGLLRIERHHNKKSKPRNSLDPKLYTDAVINMNKLCENCHLPKLSESKEMNKSLGSDHQPVQSNSKANLKNFGSSTSKHVQTSKSKLRHKRIKHGDELKRRHSKSVNRKKEIYIITGGDTPLKFSFSQEQLRYKQRRIFDKLPIEGKIEKESAIECQTKKLAGITSRDTVCLMVTPNPNVDLVKLTRNPDAVAKDASNSNDKDTITVNKPDATASNKDLDRVTVATEISYHMFGKRGKAVSSKLAESLRKRDKYDFPRVISTKLKQKLRKSEVTLSDKTKSCEERSHRRRKKEHRHKHPRSLKSNSNDLSLALVDICTESDDKIETSKRISSILKNNFRKQRARQSQSILMNEDLEVRRKRILDNIEKAYSKHKHILPKEAVDALDRNIKQWRSMDLEIAKKASDQVSNVLDLEEVLKKSRKVKHRSGESNGKQTSEKTITTTSESTLQGGLKKHVGQNNLILLNSIVTGVNDVDCDKETVHVNKIPKFVRLKEIIVEPDTTSHKKILSKINLIQECISEQKSHVCNAPPKAHRILHPVQFSDEVRKEVSFSQLNVKPEVSQYSASDQRLNFFDGLLPIKLKDRRVIRPRRKIIYAEKDCLNVFTFKRNRSPSKVSLEPMKKLVKSDSVYKVDGIEPPKRHNVYTASKGTNLKKLNLAVLPVLQVPTHSIGAMCFAEGIVSTSSAKSLRNSKTQTRKKENHRMLKSCKSSASSSESTLQLMNLLDRPVKIHSVPERRKRTSNVKKCKISDKEAIAALKYLSPQHRDYSEPVNHNLYRRRKLKKIILSTVEIRSEIPTSDEKITKNLEKSSSNGFNKRSMVPSKETELLFKANQESGSPESPCVENSNFNLNDQAFEDYVTKDKYDEKRSDRSRGKGQSSISSFNRSSSILCKEDKRVKSVVLDSRGVRSRMMSYSRNIEKRKKRPRSSTGTSRDSSVEKDNDSSKKNDEEHPKTRSISGASTSSGVSINTESENQSDKCKSEEKDKVMDETKPDSDSKSVSLNESQKEGSDTLNAVSEAISTALTKITEETLSQDTLNGLEFSHYSKAEVQEPKSVESTAKKVGNSVDERKIVKDDASVSRNETVVHPDKPDASSNKDTKLPRSERSERARSPSTSKPKHVEIVVKKDPEIPHKRTKANTRGKNVLPSNAPTAPAIKEEPKEAPPQQSLKEDEIRQLTESVKNSIISEMQVINTKNINNLMQLFMKKKEESDRSSLEAMITKNIESILKKKPSVEEANVKNEEKPPSKNVNVGGDFKSQSIYEQPTNFDENSSVKSVKSKKSDRIPSVFKTCASEAKDNNPYNNQKIQIISSCNLDNSQTKTADATATKSLVNKGKGKRISKLARSIPKSVLFRDKESASVSKPVSAPTGFDRNRFDTRLKKPGTGFEKSISSVTKASLTSTRISSAKETSRTAIGTSKDSKTLSKFEKRKQYGELLRQKATKTKNENVDKSLCSGLADGDNTIKEVIEEKVPTEPSSKDQKLVSECKIEAHPEIKSNANGLCNFHDSSKKLVETTGTITHVHVNACTSATILETHETKSNKTNSTAVGEENENIYQTFTVMANHPYIVDVFKNKFGKTDSSLSTINKGSVYSNLSTMSINSIGKTTCRSNSSCHQTEKIKSTSSYNDGFKEIAERRSLYDGSESELSSTCDFRRSSSVIACKADSETNPSVKRSRVKVNFVEACQQLCEYDDSKPKCTVYSPCTCNGKNAKPPEKVVSPRDNLHRCKHKFNIHSMLKINQTDETVTSPVNTCSKAKNFQKPCVRESEMPIKISRLVQKNAKSGEGNYVVFKIDKKLQLREQSSNNAKDTSGECFKIFMNNNLHKMQFDSDYPLRFSNYALGSKLFHRNAQISQTGESGYGSSNSKEQNFLRSLSKEMNPNLPGAITFPFNLKKNSSKLNSCQVLSAERDLEEPVRTKTRLEQLCESVTNLYNTLCNSTSTEKLNSEHDTGYVTDHDRTHFYTCYHFNESNPCSSYNCPKYKKSQRNNTGNQTLPANVSKNVKLGTDRDTPKMHYNKLTQANTKRKHKKASEHLLRSLSDNSVKQDANLQSISELCVIVTAIIKNLMTSTQLNPDIPVETLRPIVEDSLNSYIQKPKPSRDVAAKISQGTSNAITKEKIEEQVQDVSSKLSGTLLPETYLVDLIQQILDEVLERVASRMERRESSESLSSDLSLLLKYGTSLDYLQPQREHSLQNRRESNPEKNANSLILPDLQSQEDLDAPELDVDLHSNQSLRKRKTVSLVVSKSSSSNQDQKGKLSKSAENKIVPEQNGKLSEEETIKKTKSLHETKLPDPSADLSRSSAVKLISDLKAFDETLTDLKSSITSKQSEFCTLKSCDWKLLRTSSATKCKSCKCVISTPLEPNELLQIMSKMPLNAIMKLYKKVSSGDVQETTFESLIHQLCEDDALENKIEKPTESQDCILKALRSTTTRDNICAGKDEEVPCDSKKPTEKIETETNSPIPKTPESPKQSQKQTTVDQKKPMTQEQTTADQKKPLTQEQTTADQKKPVTQEQTTADQKKPVTQEQTTADQKKPVTQKPPRLLTDERMIFPEEKTDEKYLRTIRKSLTDKEMFDKVLKSYENEENIVHRLSNDEEFLKSQLTQVKSKEFVEELLNQPKIEPTRTNARPYFKEDSDDNQNDTTKKSSSMLFTLKRKVSRLFKTSSQDISKQTGFRNYAFEGIIDGRRRPSKPRILETLNKDESSTSSSDDSNKVKPHEIGRYFKRGFRSDQMYLSNGTKTVEQNAENISLDSIIELSERDTPLDYLLALGYSIEEASNAIKDEDVENRLLAAITEARIWVNHVNKVQGTLLYLLAYKAKPKIMRYFLQLVEAVVNNRIDNAVKLNSFLKILEKVEDGDINMIHILGSDKFEDEEDEEYVLKKQLRRVFIDVFRTAERVAENNNETLTLNQINLLKQLAAQYRAGLRPHLELMAMYIGKGSLHSQIQLEAAMIYFSRLDSADVDLAKFERYCGIKSRE